MKLIISLIFVFLFGAGISCNANITITNETNVAFQSFHVAGKQNGKSQEILKSLVTFDKKQTISVQVPEDGLLLVTFRTRPPKIYSVLTLKNVTDKAHVNIVQKDNKVTLELK